MSLRRSAHAVYEAQYHLVWCPKYRKAILQGAVAARLRALFQEIGYAYDVEIDTMEVAADHVHLFVSFPPRLSVAQAVTRLKSLSARALFAEFPQLRRQLWGGELWEDGYFFRTVGEQVTAEVIRRYILRHRGRGDQPPAPGQPGLFPDPDEAS